MEAENKKLPPQYCVKSYDTITKEGNVGMVSVEHVVHYTFLWIFVRVTAVRYRFGDDPIGVLEIPRSREWITTSGIGWMRLEQM
jgi:hypothetical protein